MPPAHLVPPISRLTLRFFRGIVRRYFRRHFRAVLAQYPERLRDTSGPLIVYGNHSSWWDPMLIVLLGDQLLPNRKHYAPMDAEALKKYPILRKLGIFPVDGATPRGAAQFLRTAEAILHAGGVLWLTPQGRFADPRERPLGFRPGLGAVARRLPDVPLLPLAVEYTFWDERLPEALLHFGQPFQVDPTEALSAQGATQVLESALATAMANLGEAVIGREPSRFTPLFTGSRGTGGIYSLFRQAGALLRGHRLDPDHTQRP